MGPKDIPRHRRQPRPHGNRDNSQAMVTAEAPVQPAGLPAAGDSRGLPVTADMCEPRAQEFHSQAIAKAPEEDVSHGQ